MIINDGAPVCEYFYSDFMVYETAGCLFGI